MKNKPGRPTPRQGKSKTAKRLRRQARRLVVLTRALRAATGYDLTGGAKVLRAAVGTSPPAPPIANGRSNATLPIANGRSNATLPIANGRGRRPKIAMQVADSLHMDAARLRRRACLPAGRRGRECRIARLCADIDRCAVMIVIILWHASQGQDAPATRA